MHITTKIYRYKVDKQSIPKATILKLLVIERRLRHKPDRRVTIRCCQSLRSPFLFFYTLHSSVRLVQTRTTLDEVLTSSDILLRMLLIVTAIKNVCVSGPVKLISPLCAFLYNQLSFIGHIRKL